MNIFVTGGSGFIGSNFIRYMLRNDSCRIINFDKLTYAGNPDNLRSVSEDPRYVFIRGDIVDSEHLQKALSVHCPDMLINFAAESHVDASIHGPEDFIETNIVGTYNLLEAIKQYIFSPNVPKADDFRFLHVSTDEVYGQLSEHEHPFTERSAFKPRNPYSASKAASDHIVQSYNATYEIPTLITHCSNNYGPYQFPEKLIPVVILNAVEEKPIPIYGDGKQIRDWISVYDHCSALEFVLSNGTVGENYNIGANNEKSNLELVGMICSLLDDIAPRGSGYSYSDLISFVVDRPGHDRRYAIDFGKIKELGWSPSYSFHGELKNTVDWYLNNKEWVGRILTGQYRDLGGNIDGARRH